jgi:ABC-type Mn2+/Zn2+ transport system permease subunit
MKNSVGWISLVVAAVAALIIFLMPGEPTVKLQLAIGYALLVLVFFFGAVVLFNMITGKIDISELLEEESTGASTSRFQLLIFTFVISLSFFFLVAKDGKFPEISADVLALLGISATTYGVSKGIQASMPKSPPSGGDGSNGVTSGSTPPTM